MDAVKQILENYTQFVLVESEEDKVRWKDLEKKIHDLYFTRNREYMDYQITYYKEHNEDAREIALLLQSNHKDVGLWSLVIIKNNGVWSMDAGADEILEPFFDDAFQLTPKTKRKIYRACLQFVTDVAKAYHINELLFAETVFGPVSLWHRFLMENGATIDFVTHDAYHDLTLPEEEARKRMHKKVGQSIKPGYELYDYIIVDKNSPDIDEKMELFRQFHIKVAGRETRSRRTWELQAAGIHNSEDFAVFLYDRETGSLDGASLFNVSTGNCYYSVAVYDRDKFDRPIGHVSQDIAIRHLREKGIHWYIVGERCYANDTDDRKLLSIGDYKEAFSTDIFVKLHLKLAVDMTEK